VVSIGGEARAVDEVKDVVYTEGEAVVEGEDMGKEKIANV